MSRLYSHLICLKSPNHPLFLPSKHFPNPLHFSALKPKSPNLGNSLSWSNPNNNSLHWRVTAFQSDITVQKSDNGMNLDAFLSIVEILCLASSAVISVGYVIVSSSKKPVFELLGSRVFVWQFVLLVGAVAIGASIRRRQWRRVCSGMARAEGGGSGVVDFVGRIEKLEEDLRSSATIIRVLSRQLEKLGIRFRVTRRSLKDPIAEAAALAQKSSEATRALAVKEDILEKELTEIQTVLLAMQEQQKKQLDLILAIAKSGNLFDKKPVPVQKKEAVEKRHAAERVVKQTATPQIQSLVSQKEANKEAA